jgi:hypothetical protein
MSMLDSPVLRSNAHLMDKMFTCLSYASSGIPVTAAAQNAVNAAQQTPPPPPNDHAECEMLSKQIELVVTVLKNKQCTQDGLQQAYSLLNNLSKINSATRNMIIEHLLKGTRELGLAVCREIDVLLDEAVKYTQSMPHIASSASLAESASEASLLGKSTPSLMVRNP